MNWVRFILGTGSMLAGGYLAAGGTTEVGGALTGFGLMVLLANEIMK